MRRCSLCKQQGHNKRTCGNDLKINKVMDKMPKIKKPEEISDLYTEKKLRNNLRIHKNYINELMAENHDIDIRKPNFPEHISENIIKFTIHNKLGDKTSTWNCKGDLLSKIEGKQECKAFTSKGPISFTPSSKWDCIYFLDACDWLNDQYVLYRVPLTIDSEEWKGIKVNNLKTFEDHSKQGRRPRIGWVSLYPQILKHCEKIYEGTFENIFIEETV